MQQDEYDAWAQRHATAFGWTGEADLKMLAAWYEVLGPENPDDLHEATNRILRTDYPSFARDHLKAILAQIRLLKAERALVGSRVASEGDRGSCAKCGGSGRVIVPHPRSVVDGEWVPLALTRGGAQYYSACVCCSCGLGRWYHEHGSLRVEGRERRMMTLEEYEQINPRWPIHLGVRQAETRDVARLTPPVLEGGLARQNARRLDRVLDHLADAFGMPTDDGEEVA